MFFFKQKTADEMRISDWSSDVCSSDLKLHDLLVAAGFRSRVLDDIRSEIWLKAWGNLSFNPISALTHATLEDICTFPETRKLAATMMAEAQQIAEKLGVTFRHTLDKRIEGAKSGGTPKNSMPQEIGKAPGGERVWQE